MAQQTTNITNFRVIIGGKATSNEKESPFFCSDLALIQYEKEMEKADKCFERVKFLAEKLGKGKTRDQNKWLYSQYMIALTKFHSHIKESGRLRRAGTYGS